MSIAVKSIKKIMPNISDAHIEIIMKHLDESHIVKAASNELTTIALEEELVFSSDFSIVISFLKLSSALKKIGLYGAASNTTTLPENVITDILQITSLQILILEYLDLTENCYIKLGQASLVRLHFNVCNFNDKSAEAIAKSNTLSQLNISFGSVSLESLMHLLSMKNLTSIEINRLSIARNNNLTAIDEKKFPITKLNRLSIGNMDINDDDFSAIIVFIRNLKNFKFLNLAYCKLLTAKSINQLTQCKIDEIQIDFLNGVAFNTLQTFAKDIRCRTLNIRKTAIGNQVFDELLRNPYLISFTFHDPLLNYFHPGNFNLQKNHHNWNLRKLNLDHCPGGDNISTITERCPSLTNLSVIDCGITENGAISLADTLISIQELKIAKNSIGKKGVSAFLRLPTLQQFHFYECIAEDFTELYDIFLKNNSITLFRMSENRLYTGQENLTFAHEKFNEERSEENCLASMHLILPIFYQMSERDNQMYHHRVFSKPILFYMIMEFLLERHLTGKEKIRFLGLLSFIDRLYIRRHSKHTSQVRENNLIKEIKNKRPETKITIEDIQRLLDFMEFDVLRNLCLNEFKSDTLILRDKEMTRHDARALKRILDENESVTTLDLSNNMLHEDGAAVLAESNTLLELNISSNHINEGMIGFENNTKLKVLDASNNPIGGRGIHHLALNKSITTLILRQCKTNKLNTATFFHNKTLKLFETTPDPIHPNELDVIMQHIAANKI